MGSALWMKEGRTLSQPVQQEGREQVAEQQAARTGHLQRSAASAPTRPASPRRSALPSAGQAGAGREQG